jgi:hypothetical protein
MHETMSCPGKAIHALRECECYFKPADFLELLARETRWIELLLTAIMLRRELQNIDIKLAADDSVVVALAKRGRWLRN